MDAEVPPETPRLRNGLPGSDDEQALVVGFVLRHGGETESTSLILANFQKAARDIHDCSGQMMMSRHSSDPLILRTISAARVLPDHRGVHRQHLCVRFRRAFIRYEEPNLNGDLLIVVIKSYQHPRTHRYQNLILTRKTKPSVALPFIRFGTF